MPASEELIDPHEIAEQVQFEYNRWLEQLPDATHFEDVWDEDLGPARIFFLSYQQERDVGVIMPNFPDETDAEPVSEDSATTFKIERLGGHGPSWKYIQKDEDLPEAWSAANPRNVLETVADLAIDALEKGEIVKD